MAETHRPETPTDGMMGYAALLVGVGFLVLCVAASTVALMFAWYWTRVL